MTSEAPVTQADELLEQLSDEADLCRNDGANDIADLLDEARAWIAAHRHQAEQRGGEADAMSINEADLCRLEAAARRLLKACHYADANEDLSLLIDGEMMDELDDALNWRFPVIWTAQQVAALNASQEGYGHPFTCGGERGDEAHRAYADEHGGDLGQLVATPRGWVCPVCDYRQTWAHPHQFMGGRQNPLTFFKTHNLGTSPAKPSEKPHDRS